MVYNGGGKKPMTLLPIPRTALFDSSTKQYSDLPTRRTSLFTIRQFSAKVHFWNGKSSNDNARVRVWGAPRCNGQVFLEGLCWVSKKGPLPSQKLLWETSSPAPRARRVPAKSARRCELRAKTWHRHNFCRWSDCDG